MGTHFYEHKVGKAFIYKTLKAEAIKQKFTILEKSPYCKRYDKQG